MENNQKKTIENNNLRLTNNNINLINNNINNKNKDNIIINKNNKNNPLTFKPISLYKQPTLIRLQNKGVSSLMNSILQCLSQTEELANYFLDEKHLPKLMNNNITIKNKQSP